MFYIACLELCFGLCFFVPVGVLVLADLLHYFAGINIFRLENIIFTVLHYLVCGIISGMIFSSISIFGLRLHHVGECFS